MKSVLLIINPNSNNGKAKKYINQIIDVFKNNNISIKYKIINNFDDIKTIAKTDLSNYTHIGACGGDGTLNAVVNCFINSNKTIFFIPLGTVNIFAKEFSIPKNPVKAAREIIKGKEIKLNIFFNGEKYAILMISAGLDSYVVNKISQKYKTHSKWHYIFETLKEAFTYSYPDIKIKINEQIISGKFIFAGQSTRYAGFLNFIPHSSINDGWINICILKKAGPIAHLAFFLKTLLGIHTKSKNVEILKCKELKFLAPENVFLQIDGDIYKPIPSNFTLLPQKLSILVP